MAALKLGKAPPALLFTARVRRCPFFLPSEEGMERREAPGVLRYGTPMAGQ